MAAKLVTSGQARAGRLGGLGIRFLVGGEETGGGFSVVEHPLAPRALAAPLHRHANEDEYSFILRGRVGAKLGDEVLVGAPGDLIHKPRGQWHTFWNAGDDEASLLEIIAPAGFERYFAALVEMFPDGRPQPERIGPVAERFGLEIDPSTIPDLCAAHALRFG